MMTFDEIDMQAIEADMRMLTSEDLAAREKLQIMQDIRRIAESAVLLKLMRERGEDLPDHPSTRHLLKIADGRLDPVSAMVFSESPCRRRIEQLPVAVQRQVAENPIVPYYDGETTRMVDLRTASKEIGRVVIKTPGEII